MLRRWIAVVALSGCGAPPPAADPPAPAMTAEPAPPVAEPPATDEPAPTDNAPPVKLASTPVELASLPEWAPAGGEARVRVHAAGAPALLLAAVLAGRDRLVLGRVPGGGEVTGRVSTGDTLTALKRLVDHRPSIAGAVKTPARGHARRVDLLLWRASARRLFELLGVIINVDVIGVFDDVDVVAATRGQPTDVVLDNLAQTLGLTPRRRGRALFVLANPAIRFDPMLSSIARPRVDLVAREALAGEVVDVLTEVTGATLGSACNDGEPITLSLRREPLGIAAIAVSLVGKQPVALSRQACRRADSERIDPADKLVVIGFAGKRGAALFRKPDGAVVVVRHGDTIGGERVRIALSGVRFGRDRFIAINPDPWPDSDAARWESWLSGELELGRLAATVIGPGKRAAIVERAGGGYLLLTIRGKRLEVSGASLATPASYHEAEWLMIEPGRLVAWPGADIEVVKALAARR